MQFKIFAVTLYRNSEQTMEQENKYIASADVKTQGRTAYYKMLEKAHQGELIQVRRGVYADIDGLSGNMVDIETIVPDGILCMWSAWNTHQLTTSMPQAYHVAISRERKVRTPDFPKVELHYYSKGQILLGMTERTIDGYKVRIYDQERCVCDAIKFRNKIGMDVCSEILNNYLNRPDRNLSRLLDYARQLRVATTLEKYLEVKL